MPRLILNADDFGLTSGVNRAISELHAAGALTSATLMANRAAFDDAVTVSSQHPSLGVGCHIVLVDGTPVSPPSHVESLLSDRSPSCDSLRHTPGTFLRDISLRRVRPQDIEREAIAQITKVQQAGIHVTHVDTHKHLHAFPAVLRPVLRAAQACGVQAIRNPYEPAWSLRLTKGAGWLRELEVRLVRMQRGIFLREVERAGIKTTDGCIGVLATGNMTEALLQEMLEAMPAGTWELVSHPGSNDAELQQARTRLTASREIELHAMINVVPAFTGLHQIHYGDL